MVCAKRANFCVDAETLHARTRGGLKEMKENVYLPNKNGLAPVIGSQPCSNVIVWPAVVGSQSTRRRVPR